MPRNLSEMIQVGLPTATFGDNARARGRRSSGTRRSATRSCSASRSASSARSRRGTTRCTRSRTRSLRRSPRAAPSSLKPSEVAPINAFILAEIVDEAGLPKGVFNLVTGVGPVVGEAIAEPPARRHGLVHRVHPRRQARHGAARRRRVKRVSLELGGKSANIILRGRGPRRRPCRRASSRCYLNSGQTCSALTRMLVPRSKLAEVEEARHGARRRPSRPATRSSRGHRPRPARLGGAARPRARLHPEGHRGGGDALTGGPEAPEGLDKGYFVRPTVFSERHQRHDDRP